jgi:hypothetical protein
MTATVTRDTTTAGAAATATGSATATLTSKAMLAKLRIGAWSGAKHDQELAGEIEQKHTIDASFKGAYLKRLLSDQSLKRLRSIVTEAREEHRKRTLPWLDQGAGNILSSAGYFEYMRVMNRLRGDFETAVSDFVAAYPGLVAEAKQRLNGAFRASDYPSAHEMQDRFSFKLVILPLPAEGDFRVSLGESEVARIRAEIEDTMAEQLTQAQREVARRIKEAAERMAERLRAYRVTEDKVENPFRDSLVENVRELVNILPTLNIADDPDLTALTQRMRDDLAKWSPDTLRQSSATRERTATAAEQLASEADDILKAMGDFV